jgi:drug/metabolite transporter (DMT)-like permease
MIYLLFSILFATLLYVIFRLFKQFEINNQHAIVVNYITAFSVGFISGESTDFNFYQNTWLVPAAILGISFYLMFNLLAYSSQTLGIAVTSIANKMSVVIPVIFSFVLYHDNINILKISGIILAVAGVYLTSVNNNKNETDYKSLLLIAVLFFGNGLIDTYIKFSQNNYVPENQLSSFVMCIFLFAGISGMVHLAINKQIKISRNNIIGGILLGLPNYFSIFFLVKALNEKNMESSVVFPLNNIGIVVCGTICGYFAFKEKLSSSNWAGVVLSVLAITLIALSGKN